MTKTEERVLRNLIARLKKPNLGCANTLTTEGIAAMACLNAKGYGVASRLYVDTWVIPAMELLLSETRDPKLAERLSR